jgi:hypothetical protein
LVLPLPLKEEFFELFVLLVLHFLHWCWCPRPRWPLPPPGLRPLAPSPPPRGGGARRMSAWGRAAEHPSTHGCLDRLRSNLGLFAALSAALGALVNFPSEESSSSSFVAMREYPSAEGCTAALPQSFEAWL